jgi:uncharacterized membrane protein YkvA (DUF1232 family)
MTLRRIKAFRALWDAIRGARSPGTPGVGARLAAVPRMVAMAITGRYPHLGRGRLVLMAVAVGYVLSPVDLLPELFIAVLGLGDDALLATWLAGTLLAEAEAFLAWEAQEARTVVVQPTSPPPLG